MTQPGDHTDPAAKSQADIEAARKQQQQHAPTDQAGLGGGGDDSIHDSATAALQDGHILFNPPAGNFTAAATEARMRAELGNGVPFTQTATLQVGDQRVTGALSGNRLVTPDGQYQVQPNGQGSYDVRPMDAHGRVDPHAEPVQARVTFERPLDQPMSQPRPQPNQGFDATPNHTAGDTNRIAAPPANPHQTLDQTNVPVKPQPVAEAPVNPHLNSDNSSRPGAITNPTQNPPPQHGERPPVGQQANPPPADRPIVTVPGQPPVERVPAPLPVQLATEKNPAPQGDRPPTTISGVPHNDIRPLSIASNNPVAPGTDVRVVPVNPPGPDGRVQHIAVEMNVKAIDNRVGGGGGPIEGRRSSDAPGPTGKTGDPVIKGGPGQAGEGGVIPRGFTDGAMPPGRGGIPGLNLVDVQNRQFITAVIGQLQTDRLGTFDPRSQNLTDVLKGFDPARVGALQNFFTHMTAEGGRPGVLTGEMMIARLHGMLNTQDAALRANADLSAMLRGGAQRETAGGAYLTELTRTLDGINRHSGMENAITLSNLVGRQLGDQNAGNLVARLLPGQENVVRNMLDTREGTAVRAAGREQAQAERATERAEGRADKSTSVPDKGETAGRPDATSEAHATRVADAAAAAAAAASAIKEDAQDAGFKQPDEHEKDKDKLKAEEKTKKHEETDPQAEQETARRAALAALLAAKKLKDDSEKEEKEKEQAQEKDKKEEESKRRRYIVKEKDTLQSIASRQLRDIRLAPLILQINRAVIPVTVQRGREVVNLKVGTSIWLPSMTDIKEFRGRLASATTSAPASTEPKFASVEEELATKFGVNWAGTGNRFGAATTQPPQTPPGTAEAAPPAPPGSAESELMADALAVSQTRRENIERLLGPIGKQKETSDRIRYVIRLGDTLKSVAMKHPALLDISLWKLVAKLNDMTEETDERGMPLAKLSRGTILALPTVAEIEAFKAEQRGDASPPRDTELLTVECLTCGTSNATFATTCSACSSQLRASEPEPAPEVESGPDAAMILLQAAGFVTKSKPKDSEEI